MLELVCLLWLGGWWCWVCLVLVWLVDWCCYLVLWWCWLLCYKVGLDWLCCRFWYWWMWVYLCVCVVCVVWVCCDIGCVLWFFGWGNNFCGNWCYLVVLGWLFVGWIVFEWVGWCVVFLFVGLVSFIFWCWLMIGVMIVFFRCFGSVWYGLFIDSEGVCWYLVGGWLCWIVG